MYNQYQESNFDVSGGDKLRCIMKDRAEWCKPMRSTLMPIITKNNYVVINFKSILNSECHVKHKPKRGG